MSWLKKLMPPRIRTETGTNARKRSVPEGLWEKCERCSAVLYGPELEENLEVCPKCNFHRPIRARARLRTFLDPGELDEIAGELDALPAGQKVMLKLTIPTVPDFYKPLVDHRAVARVVALSGGYSRADACEKLSRNHGMIASFSRALTEDLRRGMSDADFNATLGRTIDEIYRASAVKA